MMTAEQCIQLALSNFDTRAERSLRNLVALLLEAGATEEEIQREIDHHREELAAERTHVAETVMREMREADACFTGGSGELH